MRRLLDSITAAVAFLALPVLLLGVSEYAGKAPVFFRVANLTIGTKGYEAVEEEMKDVARKAAGLRKLLTASIDRDADAYSEVMAAFKLPRATDREKESRKSEIQKAFKQAALDPLEVANQAVEVINLAGIAVNSGNKNAVTDGVVAAMNARTAALSALYNVKINLGSIEDDEFVQKLTREINDLENQAKSEEQKILVNLKI